MLTTAPGTCSRYPWCRAVGAHTEHFSESHVVHAFGGREVSAFIAADGELSPTVTVEVRFNGKGPVLPVLDLDPDQAAALAEVLRRLAVAAQTPLGP